LRTVPIIATLVVSTTLLAYIVSAQPSQPYAQLQQRPQVAQRESGPKPQAAQPPTVSRPGVPNDDKLVMLILSTLIALNQANATGNYSVFRDMGSPGFQAANSQAKLAEAFANLRRRNLDLSPILFFQPKLLRKPEINASGMLRVTGFFATKPEQVNFDLLYQPVQGQWRLFGIAADTSRVQPAATAPVAPQTAPAQEGPSPSAPTSGPSPERLTAPQEPRPAEKIQMPDIRDRLEVPKVKPEVGASPATRPKPKEDSNPFTPF
jgi:hypothetical protein